MRSLLPATVLAASVLVARGGIPGCSSETDSDADKMSGPMAKRDTSKPEPETKVLPSYSEWLETTAQMKAAGIIPASVSISF